jgi:hypothetical protein
VSGDSGNQMNHMGEKLYLYLSTVTWPFLLKSLRAKSTNITCSLFSFYLRIILWLVLRLFIITCSFKSSCDRMDFGLTVFIICASGEEPNILKSP